MIKAEVKLLFAGPPGVGKTTAITAISDKAPVSTDVATTDELSKVKDQTTVAMDYSSLILEDGTKLGLYGTPGQGRFEFMWTILAQGALGLILLIDGSSATAEEEFKAYLKGFENLISRSGVVVGINKVNMDFDVDPFARILEEQNIVAPVVAVDIREKGDVQMLAQMLLATLEFV